MSRWVNSQSWLAFYTDAQDFPVGSIMMREPGCYLARAHDAYETLSSEADARAWVERECAKGEADRALPVEGE